MSTRRLWPLLLPYALRSARTLPLLIAVTAAVLLLGVPALVSGGMRLIDVVLLIRSAAVLIAVGAAFLLDDPAARTTEVVPTPRWVVHGLRIFVALLGAAAGWATVLLLGAMAVNPDERPLLPQPGLTLEAAALLAMVIALAALGFRLSTGNGTGAGTGGGALAAPGVVMCVIVSVLLPLPEAVDPFAQPLSAGWDPSRRVWALVLCVAVVAAVALCRETAPGQRALGLRALGRRG
ncbi:hypothetical protein [Streptomyces sp. NPDC005283]|uniref:hypothetical protein n=1 Tax=Streptomyces sp. NPDC005283 TaxID=3156871 RepID=UPI0034572F4B